jgi:hypothetical protein
MRKLKISDFLVQTAASLSSLGFQRLGGEGRDLAQARLAIEALRALVPVISEGVSPEAVSDLNQVVASMQLAYAKAVSEGEPHPRPSG